MGTPEYTLPEALMLFHDIGLDGAEIVVQDDYKCGIPVSSNFKLLEDINSLIQKYNMNISCLTPYNSHFNSADKDVRERDIADILKIIGYADYLGAGYIRLYAGSALEKTDFTEDNYERLRESMWILGENARSKKITLLLENHFNTMTVSAKDSVYMMQKINHPNVRILYDQANLAFMHLEDYQEAINLQKDYISYVHVKDLVYKNSTEGTHALSSSDVTHQTEEERIVSSRIVGEGILPWPAILKELISVGYDGWLSLEYERRWHPADIPDAKTGMKKSAQYIHKCLNAL